MSLRARDAVSIAKRTTVAVLVPALLAAACTAGPSTRPAVVQRQGSPTPQQETTAPQSSAPLPPLEEPRQRAIDWKTCDEQTRRRLGEHSVPGELEFSCAGVITPAAAPGPGRGVKRIHVLKVGSGSVPLVVLNDIGGAPGSLYAARLAARLPAEFLQRFALIGVDRRGSGLSDPVNCVPADVRQRLLDHDPAQEDIGDLVDAARSAGQKCAIALDSERGAYDSGRTAGDLERVRTALGISHLHGIARGEGSNVLTAYAARFPGKVGRFVLDGAPDPSPNTSTVYSAIAEAGSAALTVFNEQCQAEGCALGTDAPAAVTQLVDRLRDSPAETAAGYRMGPGLALRAVRTGLAQPHRWGELGSAIAAANEGDPEPLAAFVDPLLRGAGGNAARLGGMLATVCSDSSDRPPTQRVAELLSQLEQQHPPFAGISAQRLAWCSPWPPPEDPTTLTDISGVPPMLVTSAAADPITPEQGTARAASQLPTAVRVAWQGAGHGSLRSSCVADAVYGFLAEGEVPQQRTLCPA